MRPVAVVGIGKTPFGAFPGRDLRSLAVEAGEKCLKNGHTDPDGIDAFFLGNFAGPSFVGQNHLAPYVSTALGIHGVPATRVEAACASSGSAFFHAWAEVAAGIYDLVMQISEEYNHPIIEITESGCSYLDTPYEKEKGRVPDTRRTVFFRDELRELARAIADGANVRSFHAWSLLDNFEWNDGYSQRYGLTFVDFRDQKRTVKDSGLWYGRVAAANGLEG